jgi:hypothetical protein
MVRTSLPICQDRIRSLRILPGRANLLRENWDFGNSLHPTGPRPARLFMFSRVEAMDSSLNPLLAGRSGGRGKLRRAALICACSLACVSAIITLTFVFPALERKYVLEDKDCTDEELAAGSCHIDGNQQWKDEDVSDRWSTADWMNGYNEVTGTDVNTDEYKPWADKVMASLGVSDTDPSIMSFGALIPPPLAANIQVVSGTTVIVSTCDPLWGCRHDYACVDRYSTMPEVCNMNKVSTPVAVALNSVNCGVITLR